MKLKTLESVWTYMKKKCPEFIIVSSIKKLGNIQIFEVIIPKTRVSKWPAGVSNKDLEFTITSNISGIFGFLEVNNQEFEIYDTADIAENILYIINLSETMNQSKNQDEYRKFFNDKLKKFGVSSPAELSKEDISKFFNEIKDEWAGVNETYINEASVFDVQDANIAGWDSCIGFEYTSSRANLEKNLKKLNRKYLLSVLPDNEAELYCKKQDVDTFTGFLKSLKESMNEANNMLADEKFISAYSSEFAMICGYLGCRPESCYYVDSNKHPELYKEITSKLGKIDIDLNIKKNNGGKYTIQIYNSISIAHFSVQGAFSGYVISPANKLKLALNEAELVKTTGKIFTTASERGMLSPDAIMTTLKTLSGQMSELSTNPSEESVKAYKECEDEYQCLIDELTSRGLKL